MEEKNLIQIPDGMDEILMRSLCYFGSTYLSNDLYYLKRFIDMMINIIGREKVIQMLKEDNSENKKRLNEIGNNFEKVEKELIKFDRFLNLAKGFYDNIEDKKFNDIDKNEKQITNFMRYAKNIPLIKPDIYSLTIFFWNNSSLKKKTFKSEYWRILEHRGFRAVGEFKQKRVGEENVPIYRE